MRLLSLLFTTILFLTCNDPHQPQHDAGPDGDVIVDVDADTDVVDAEIDVMDIPECIPWQTTDSVPPEAITQVPVAGERFDESYWTSIYVGMVSEENLVFIYEPPAEKHQIWHVDLRTFDATQVTENNVYSDYYPSIWGNLITGRQCAGTTFEECGLFLYSLETGIWENLIYNVRTETHETMYWYTSTGDGFTLYFQNYKELATEKAVCDLRLIDHETKEVEILVDAVNYDGCGHHYAAAGRFAAYCAANTAYDAWVLWFYDRETGEKTEVDTSSLGQCKFIDTVDGQKVLFETAREVWGYVDGEPVSFDDWENFVYDHETGEIYTIANNPWWDLGSQSLKWPLVVYADYSVYCHGYGAPGLGEHDLAYMVIMNVESGVARPIPIPSNPSDWSDLHSPYPMGILSSPWRVVYGDWGNPDYWHAPTVHVLNLETAGLVDSQGNVIPDPTYPPTDATQ